MSQLQVNTANGTRELKKLLVNASNANIPTLILGPPGTGKTSSIRQVTAETKREYFALDAQLANPEDLSGIPWVRNDETMICTRPSWLPDRANDRATVFIDDLTNCPSPVIMSGLYALALDKRCGQHQVHEETWVVMAGNRPADKSGAVAVNPTLANRMMVVNFTGPTDSEWLADFANPCGVNVHVREFIGAYPDRLNNFDGTKSTNSTPRSWALAGKMLDQMGIGDMHALRTAMAGIVAEDDAIALITNIQISHLIPTVAEIVADPIGAKMPPKDRMDLHYALLGRVKASCSVQDFNKVWDYLTRQNSTIRKELQVTAVKFMQVQTNNGLVGTPVMQKILNDPEIRSLFV